MLADSALKIKILDFDALHSLSIVLFHGAHSYRSQVAQIRKASLAQSDLWNLIYLVLEVVVISFQK